MPDKKLFLLKTAYIVIYCVIFGLLICELTLVIHRRYFVLTRSNQYCAQNPHIYTMRDINEGIGLSLWKTQWESYQPHAQLIKKIGNQTYIVKINGQGYRTREFSIEKPRDTLRIVCLGGSTTVQGETNEDTYPALLEKKLRIRYPQQKIEVLNLGVSGARSTYWLSRLDYLFSLHPDIIIQYEGINDICWVYFGEYSGPHRVRKKLNYSLLYQLLFPASPRSFDSYFQKTYANLSKIADRAKQEGAVYFVATFPGPDPAKLQEPFKSFLDMNMTDTWGSLMHFKYYSNYWSILLRYNELLKQFVTTHQLNDILLDEKILSPAYFVDACHTDRIGREAIADVVLNSITAQDDRLFNRSR